MTVLFFVLCGSEPAVAKTKDPPIFTRNAVEPFISYAIPLNPMHRGLWEFNLAPGYFMQSGTSIHAVGGSVSATHAFSDHWGVSAIFADASPSGSSDINVNPPGGAPAFNTAKASCGPSGCQNVSNGAASGNGFMGALAAIWDYRTGDGFRLPVMLGIVYKSLTGTLNNSSLGIKRTGRLTAVGIAGGIAPQADWWKLRISPFGLFTYSPKQPKGSLVDYNPANGAVNAESDFAFGDHGDRQTRSFGVKFTYKPWNLSYMWLQTFNGESSFILSYTKKWGGS